MFAWLPSFTNDVMNIMYVDNQKLSEIEWLTNAKRNA